MSVRARRDLVKFLRRQPKEVRARRVPVQTHPRVD